MKEFFTFLMYHKFQNLNHIYKLVKMLSLLLYIKKKYYEFLMLVILNPKLITHLIF